MKDLKAHISLLAANLIWGLGYPLYNYVMPHYIEPKPLFTATLIVAALLSLLSLIWRSKERQHVERKDVIAIVGAALLIAVLRKGMLLYGLSMTSPIDGSIIATVGPVVVFVIALIVGEDHLSRGKFFGVLLGLGGAVGVILSGGGSRHETSGMVGNLLILICAFISAVYLVWFKSLLRKYDPVTLLRWMFCIAAVVFLPFGFRSLMSVDIEGFSREAYWAVAYLVVMPTYLPNLLLTSGLSRVSPTVSSIYMYLQPTVAVAISVASGLDTLRMMTLLCGAALFVGVGLVIRSQNK